MFMLSGLGLAASSIISGAHQTPLATLNTGTCIINTHRPTNQDASHTVRMLKEITIILVYAFLFKNKIRCEDFKLVSFLSRDKGDSILSAAMLCFRCLFACLWMRTWTEWFPSPSSPRRRSKPSSSPAADNSQNSRNAPASAFAPTSNPADA